MITCLGVCCRCDVLRKFCDFMIWGFCVGFLWCVSDSLFEDFLVFLGFDFGVSWFAFLGFIVSAFRHF